MGTSLSRWYKDKYRLEKITFTLVKKQCVIEAYKSIGLVSYILMCTLNILLIVSAKEKLIQLDFHAYIWHSSKHPSIVYHIFIRLFCVHVL